MNEGAMSGDAPAHPVPRRHHRSASALLLATTALAFAPLAQAHLSAGDGGSFLGGLQHPVSGLDHVLALVCVGIWGAQLGPPALWILPITFPLVMACGGFLGLIGVPLPGTEIGIALSSILLGGLVLTRTRLALPVAMLLVGAFAIFHGHAHGAELTPGGNALWYSLGFVIATGALHACGIAIGLVHRWPWGQSVLRVAGALVLTGGGLFLWKALV